MNSVHAVSSPARDADTAACAASAEDLAAQLAQACTALWTATLSLMTAFMHTGAPAHRYLLARRIARNFHTLQQHDCFGATSRASFGQLSRRWSAKADRLAPEEQRPRGGIGWLQARLFNR